MKTIPTLDTADADRMIEAARAAARDSGVSVTVSVVDAAGQLIEMVRIDGARAHSVDLAQRKARTAAATGYATAVLAEALKGQPLSAEVLAIPGGIPVRLEGEVAGAIGVSGALPEVDEAIAAAGIAALAT